MRVIHLDLFSGIGGFHLGLKESGIEFTDHYFSEVDKHAIANYKYNFTNAKYIGSVTNVRHIIRTINLQPDDRLIITFGSPCQDFSLAGGRTGLEGGKSSLIKYALFLIRWLRPDVYIWENVKGVFSTNDGADFWAIIKAFANIRDYICEWQLVNSTWVIPQNRERIYLVGHSDGRSEPGIFPFTENDGIFDKPFREKTSSRGGFQVQPNRNAAALTQRMNKMGVDDNYINVKSNTSQGFEIANEGDSINFSNPNSKTRRGRVGKGVAQTLDTQANQGVIQVNPSLESGGKQPYQQNRVYSAEGIIPALNAGKSDLLIAAQRGRGGIKDTKQQIEIRSDENTNTLTGVQKDNLVITDNLYKGRSREYSQSSPTLRGNSGGLQISTSATNNLHFGLDYFFTIFANNGTEIKTNTGEILRMLQQEIGERNYEQWAKGIIASLLTQKVLQPYMYEAALKGTFQTECASTARELQSKNNIEENWLLLDMHIREENRNTPQRPKQVKQRIIQLTRSLQRLSYEDTPSGEILYSMWRETNLQELLQQTLFEIQKIWESISIQAESVYGGSNIRRLTEQEAEILQTFPPGWTTFGIYENKSVLIVKKIPRTQRYKLLGNAVTKDIVKMIGKKITF